jgi:hypothetical protein
MTYLSCASIWHIAGITIIFFQIKKSEQQQGQATCFPLSEAHFSWDEVKHGTKCNAYLCYINRTEGKSY